MIIRTPFTCYVWCAVSYFFSFYDSKVKKKKHVFLINYLSHPKFCGVNCVNIKKYVMYSADAMKALTLERPECLVKFYKNIWSQSLLKQFKFFIYFLSYYLLNLFYNKIPDLYRNLFIWKQSKWPLMVVLVLTYIFKRHWV